MRRTLYGTKSQKRGKLLILLADSCPADSCPTIFLGFALKCFSFMQRTLVRDYRISVRGHTTPL